MRVAALIPAGFALGAAACTLLLRHAPRTYAVDLAQPLAVVTYWQGFGAAMFAALLLAVAVAGGGYYLTLRQAGRWSGKLTMTKLVLVCALACAAALIFPVVFSSDVYAYAGYGNMALHGIDPYAHVRIALRDPLFDAVLWQWGNPPPMCVYGPAFVWLAQAVVGAFLPLGTAAPLWGFRVLACIALVVCAPLAYAAFKPLGDERARFAAAGIALNPVAIWASAEGHNDAIVLAIILAGFALAARSRAFGGAFVVALGALLKAPALAAAAGFIAALWHDGNARTRVIRGAAAGTAIALAIAAPLEYGVRAHLATGGHYFPQFSLQYVSLPVTAALAAFFAFGGIRELLRGDVEGAAYLGFTAWLAIPNPYPWYAVWLLPLAFLAKDARVMWGIIAASLLIVFRYYGDATTDVPPALTYAIVALEYGVPLALIAAARMASARPLRRESRTADLGFAMPRHS